MKEKKEFRKSPEPGNSHRSTVHIRSTVDVLFLILFAVLIAAGKIQLWFGLFAIGLLLSTVAGRFYCAWICPMHTLMRPVALLRRTLARHRKKRGKDRRLQKGPDYGRRKAPSFLGGPEARYAMLLLFVAATVSQKAFGFKAPILPILTAIAVILTIFYEEKWWHSKLCPFGTLLNGVSSRARFGLRVDHDKCTGCGLCDQACPSGAIVPLSEGEGPHSNSAIRSIDHSKCLMCYSCARACPFGSISYGSIRR